MDEVKIIDHGYLRFVEAWGKGDAGLAEAGIIEAARQSTQGSFRGWEDRECPECGGLKTVADGATCPECGGKGYLAGDARLLRFLFAGKPQHATPFEFAGMTIEVQAPIAIFREWHRHRVQSYFETEFADLTDTLDLSGFNEMSARYAPLPNLNYIPAVERLMMVSKTNKQAGTVKGADELTVRQAEAFREVLANDYANAENTYQLALKAGVPKELARLCLPVGRYSRMRATANLRNWLAFLTLRADPAAMWEIQQYAHAVGDLLAEHFPRTWALFAAARKVEGQPC